MNRFVEDRHDSHFFLEIFLRLTLFIELGISTRKCDLHVDKSSCHENFIAQAYHLQKHPCDKDKEYDIEEILRNIENTIPKGSKKSEIALTRGSNACLYSKSLYGKEKEKKRCEKTKYHEGEYG